MCVLVILFCYKFVDKCVDVGKIDIFFLDKCWCCY